MVIVTYVDAFSRPGLVLLERGSILLGMTVTVRLRRHLPIVASVVVVIVCLASVGATCVCVVGHHPSQALEQVAAAAPVALPATPATAWASALVATFVGLMVVAGRRGSFGRASPEMLQRFLF
jgi:hypothetical protein